MFPTDEALLDNPAYAALCGPHARFAQVRGRARRYPVDVAPFLGLPSPPSAQDWRDAAALIAPGTYAGVRYGSAELPDGWQAVQAFDLVQMIGERVTGVDCSEAIPLGAADVPEMLELVAQTEPGPFLTRTIELCSRPESCSPARAAQGRPRVADDRCDPGDPGERLPRTRAGPAQGGRMRSR
jgi:hypothetical protein